VTEQSKTTAAASKKGAAARAEKNGAVEKTIEFEGLTLTLPEKLPGEVIFALAGVNENPGEIVNIVGSIIGATQLVDVRAALSGRDFEDTVTALSSLMNSAISEYGTSPGESPASSPS
jgi:hypothetical protein